ncbi:hypothetical protein ACFSRY_02880 [Pontibacter locisalis]|uniref:Uncharacterized protein n=1 Tax=Pontibacter locisalis TaxID=1719035 RepID=A0ABW5IIJ5_9BACT
MKISNKLLLGLLILVLASITVLLGVAKMYAEPGGEKTEVVAPPPAPEAPNVSE